MADADEADGVEAAPLAGHVGDVDVVLHCCPAVGGDVREEREHGASQRAPVLARGLVRRELVAAEQVVADDAEQEHDEDEQDDDADDVAADGVDQRRDEHLQVRGKADAA